MGALQGPREKWARAEQQKRALYRQLTRAIDPSHHPVRAEIQQNPYPKPPGTPDTRPWTAYTVVITDAPSFGPHIGLALGEIVHNYRGALDHAAWILVRRRGRQRMSRREAQMIQFPLARSRKTFWKRQDRLLGVPKTPYWTLIERYQPYRRSTYGEAMRWLRHLTDLDKHRVIVPAVTLPQEGRLRLSYKHASPVGSIDHIRPGIAMKRGTEIVTLILADVTPGKTEVNMEGVVYSLPILPKSAIPRPRRFDALGIEHVLNSIGVTCLNVLGEIETHL